MLLHVFCSNTVVHVWMCFRTIVLFSDEALQTAQNLFPLLLLDERRRQLTYKHKNITTEPEINVRVNAHKCTQADWTECAAVLKQMMVKYGTALTVAQHAESIQDFSEELGHGRQGFQLDLLEVFRTFVFKVAVSLADAAHDRWRLWSKITSRRLTSGSQHQIIYHNTCDAHVP